MLQRLEVSNFKAWQTLDLQFGKLTGFFGTNSAGKSSILQFLLLLKQTRDATDRGLVLDFGGPSDFVNLGTFGDVVHQNDEGSRLTWRLAWSLPQTLKIDSWPDSSSYGLQIADDSLQISCDVGLMRDRPWLYRLAYTFNERSFWVQPRHGSDRKFKLGTDCADFEFLRNVGHPWPLSQPIKTHLFPEEIRYLYQNADFLSDFALAYENLMDSVYYLGPLREYPRREYHWAGSSPRDVGQRGERTMDAILAATRDGQRRSLGHRRRTKSFEEMIAYWLGELELIDSFELKEIAPRTNLFRAIVQTSQWSAPTALTDVGFGVSQVLPALVLLYYVPEGSTVLMEQPEIHLHPAVQSGLADVMLNVTEARNLQIIVESHSEHLLRRLQRRVAEEGARSEDIKLYFVSNNEGQAQISDLSLNEWGEIENWPDNFFGDEFGELASITSASLKRRLGQPS